MAEPFNVEQFRQQMSGQGVPPTPQQGQAAPAAVMPPPAPQAYQPSQMQPRPYQPQPQQMQTQMPPQMSQQAYAPQGHIPMQGQPQPWAQNAQGGQMAPAYAPPPQHQQPQFTTPQFTPPPSHMTELEMQDEAPAKTSRFSLKRAKKEKPAKAPKVKKVKAAKEAGEETVHKTKTSPAIIFMFGMATGIVAFLVGNMVMSGLLDDKTAQSFRDIERQNAQAKQPVLPGQAKLAEATPAPARAE